MTVPPRRAATADKSERFQDLYAVHRRKFGVAIAVVVLVLAAGWFWRRAEALKLERAELAYYRARQAAESGNMALAESDLRNVVTRYAGTPGGTQAALTLAQVLYGTGKFQEGIAELRRIDDPPEEFAASVQLLLAAGHEELKQFPQAAAAYLEAAKLARFPADQAAHKAAAARAFMAGGQKDAAVRIWRELADDPQAFQAGEARVRLGELTAQAAGAG